MTEEAGRREDRLPSGVPIPTGPQWSVTPGGVAAVLDWYGLRPDISTLRPIGGAVNGNARVDTGRGMVVVRVHRPWTTPARLTSVHEVMRFLRARGAPLPEVLPTLDGKTWVELDGRLVEVFEYVPHDSQASSWLAGQAAFTQLGLLHSDLAAYPSGRLVPPVYAAYATPAQALALLDVTEAAFGVRVATEGYMAALAAREQTRDILAKLAEDWQEYGSQLPSQIVHGDYGADNVLLRNGKVVAVLDFDFMAERERIFDVAYSLYWALDRIGVTDSSGAVAPDDLEHLGSLLSSYGHAAEGAPGTIELEALPLEMARVPLYWIAEAAYTPDPVGQTLAYARHLPRSRWLIEHREVVSEAASGAGASSPVGSRQELT